MCEDILMGKQTVAHQLHNYTIQNISYNFTYTKKNKNSYVGIIGSIVDFEKFMS